MNDITFSVELVRKFLMAGGDEQALNKARVAFEVVMECHEAIGDMLQHAIEREQDASLALSALRHPSETLEQLKTTLRRLADLEDEGQPLSPAFEQVMDELIAEVRLECAVPAQSSAPLQLVSSGGHGRAM